MEHRTHIQREMRGKWYRSNLLVAETWKGVWARCWDGIGGLSCCARRLASDGFACPAERDSLDRGDPTRCEHSRPDQAAAYMVRVVQGLGENGAEVGIGGKVIRS